MSATLPTVLFGICVGVFIGALCSRVDGPAPNRTFWIMGILALVNGIGAYVIA